MFASAPVQNPAPEGSDVKEGIPWSVVTGLVALGLAEAGHTGPRNILGSTLHYRFPNNLSLGSALHICNVYFKLYACCRHVHAPLDALLHLVDRHGIDVDTIETINVETYAGALRISNKSHPAHLVDVQYSIPYCLALALTAGAHVLLPLTASALSHDSAAELASRITLSLDPMLDARFPAETLARVTVTSAGQCFVSDITAPRGEASHPLSWMALEAKFRAATRIIATDVQQNHVLRAMAEARAGRLPALTDCLAGLILSRSR